MERTYLEVPFKQKDEAKALGARWDPQRKQWFAEPGTDLVGLARWLPGSAGSSSSCGSGAAGSAIAPPLAVARRPVATPFLPVAERRALAAGPPLALYTDGACKGNKDVKSKSCPAGWGVVVVEDTDGNGSAGSGAHSQGRAKVELFGPVVLDANSEAFLGAEVCSNNTGELSAICEALLWLRDYEASPRPAVIYYDSTYAANITTGAYRAQKNQRLAKTAQSLFREVQSSRNGNVKLVHVKGHSGAKWNEFADALANRGATGVCCEQGRWAPKSARTAPAVPSAKRDRPSGAEEDDDDAEAMPPSAKRSRITGV